MVNSSRPTIVRLTLAACRGDLAKTQLVHGSVIRSPALFSLRQGVRHRIATGVRCDI